jgi:ribosomal protein S18 acetylase RimI-like enzyme
MSDVLVIRTAEAEDINSIGYLAYQIWPSAYKDILNFEQLHYMLQYFYSPEALRDQMLKKHHVFLLAETEDEEPIGFASFSQAQKGIFKLHKLYVLPGLQNMNVGRSLLECVLEECIVEGADKLQLNVNRNNKAVSFYEKLGFKIIKEEDVDIGNGYLQEDYVMEKNL